MYAKTSSQSLLRPGEVARLLGVTTGGLRYRADHGKLASVRTLGGHRRYDRGQVLQAKSERIAALYDGQLQAAKASSLHVRDLWIAPSPAGAVVARVLAVGQYCEAGVNCHEIRWEEAGGTATGTLKCASYDLITRIAETAAAAA